MFSMLWSLPVDQLETRLDRLERDARTWRRIAAGLAVALIASTACNVQNETGPRAEANSGTRSLRTNLLEIVNDEGQTVAQFEGEQNGARLLLATSEGMPQISMFSGIDPGLLLTDRQSSTVQLTKGALQVGQITNEGRSTLRGARGDVKPNDEVWDALRGEPRLALGFGDDRHGGFVWVFNTLGNYAAGIEVAKTNNGVVRANRFDGEISQAMLGE
jgi:hypothetical protein